MHLLPELLWQQCCLGSKPYKTKNKQKNAVAFITWLIYAVVQAFEMGVAESSFEVQLNVKCLPHAFKKAPLHADYGYPEIL